MKQMRVVLICILLTVLVLLLVVWFARRRNRETFTSNTPETSMVVSNFLRTNGFDNIEQLRQFAEGQRSSEQLINIPSNSNLALYYSIFSHLPRDTITWQRVKGTQDATLQEVPYVNLQHGIEMLSNKCEGPPSMALGIRGNGSFTLFLYLRVQSLPKKAEPLLQVFGNTYTNNALVMTLDPQGYIHAQFGATTSSPANPELVSQVPVRLGQNTLLGVSKNADLFELWGPDQITSKVRLQVADVLLSNRRVVLNPSTNINFNLFAFGAYDVYISDMTALAKHLTNQQNKNTPSFTENARQVLEFNQELQKVHSCPFEPPVCDKCKDVDDWANLSTILETASEECLTAIDQFCTEHPDHKSCGCWRPGASQACQVLVSLHKRQPLVNMQSMSPPELEQVKKKYTLCDCSEVDNLRNEILLMEREAQRNQQVVTPEAPDPGYKSQPSTKGGFWSWLLGR